MIMKTFCGHLFKTPVNTVFIHDLKLLKILNLYIVHKYLYYTRICIELEFI